MTDGAIRQAANGELQLVGVLDYRCGPALREAGGRLILDSPAASLVLDCAAVEKSSSVGLSLLLALLRDAKALGKSLAIRNLPADMQKIAKVSGLLEVLVPPA